jgi:hypothetical protein
MKVARIHCLIFGSAVGVGQRVHGTGVIPLVKELGFLNVRPVVALPMAQTVPCNEDQHPLPKSNRIRYYVLRYCILHCYEK